VSSSLMATLNLTPLPPSRLSSRRSAAADRRRMPHPPGLCWMATGKQPEAGGQLGPQRHIRTPGIGGGDLVAAGTVDDHPRRILETVLAGDLAEDRHRLRPF